MPWTYEQQSGRLLLNSQLIGTGYSGGDDGKNNPAMQAVKDVGPIPQGSWTIVGPPYSAAQGPYVLRLQPVDGTNTFGRDGFLMHGDSKDHPGCASEGCIIMPFDVRVKVWSSGDTDLEVVAAAEIEDLEPAAIA
jgi:hypothetical protein